MTILAVLALMQPAPVQADWARSEQAIMGTRIAVEAWHPDTAVAEVLVGQVMDEMRRIDALMSHYRPESQLSAINRDAARQAVVADAELVGLISQALAFSHETGGAFDITYASVGYLYDYRAHQRPQAGEIAAALPAISWRHVQLDLAASTVRFLKDGVRIDLGGIAKGYAVDQGIAILQAGGVRHAAVTAGGDTRILGDRLGRPWMVGIRHPDDRDKVIARIPLEDAALSTSGDYERYFDEGGIRYHHILDPKTGRSAGELRSVTVIGANALLTDALSTALFVLGPEQGMVLVRQRGDVDAVLVQKDGRVLYSDGLVPPAAMSEPARKE